MSELEPTDFNLPEFSAAINVTDTSSIDMEVHGVEGFDYDNLDQAYKEIALSKIINRIKQGFGWTGWGAGSIIITSTIVVNVSTIVFPLNEFQIPLSLSAASAAIGAGLMGFGWYINKDAARELAILDAQKVTLNAFSPSGLFDILPRE